MIALFMSRHRQISKDCVKFINRKESIHTMDVMLSKQEQSDLKKVIEPLCPVHEPWVDENSESWKPPQVTISSILVSIGIAIMLRLSLN